MKLAIISLAVALTVGLCVGPEYCVAQNLDGVLYVYASGQRSNFGTGFFIDGNGRFVTAYHVLFGARILTVYDRSNGHYNDVRVLGYDALRDIAILTTNSPSPNYLTLSPKSPSHTEHLIAVGHPFGAQYQMFGAQPTQDGFIESTSLRTNQGDPIFEATFPIIPLDVVAYNGMSGGPLFASNGNVIGILEGSLNVGGGLAWGVPASDILALNQRLAGTGSRATDVSWTALSGYRTFYRNFSRPLNISAQDAIDWVNKKWSDMGVPTIYVNGFKGSIVHASADYNATEKSFQVSTEYHVTDEQYRYNVNIALEDAETTQVRRGQQGYYLIVSCPSDRACAESSKSKLLKGNWKILSDQKVSKVSIDSWLFSDSDSAQRVAAAINHLIGLHGGPVQKEELFNK